MRTVTGTTERIAFAADRRAAQDANIATLRPYVNRYLADPENADLANALKVAVATIYRNTFHDDGGTGDPNTDRFVLDHVEPVFLATHPDTNPDLLATILVVAAINAATVDAANTDPEPLVLEWVTMHDEHVREPHREADGQQRPPGETFEVCGQQLRFPGDTHASIDCWANCRCVLAPLLMSQATFPTPPRIGQSSVTEPSTGVAMTEQTIESPSVETPNVDTTDAPGITPDEEVRTPSISWHAVLAPEGEWSGDGRRFAPDSLSSRDLPLPLTWQKVADDAHKGSVTVGRIDHIDRQDGQMRGDGVFLNSPEADEVVGLLSEFGKFGISVDADAAEFELDEDEGKITFTSARIASASIVPIPAFSQAYIALGPWTDDAEIDPETGMAADSTAFAASRGDWVTWTTGPTRMRHTGRVEALDGDMARVRVYDQQGQRTGSTQNVPVGDLRSWTGPQMAADDGTFAGITERPWDGSASRFTPEQWRRSTVLHRDNTLNKGSHSLPITEPDGTLNRNAVHSAAAALAGARGGVRNASPGQISSAKRAVRAAYARLNEDPPEGIASSALMEVFRRGPGWVTDPIPTRRIHDYWTKPGQPGYEKINWGVPGDFDRCRALVGKEIAKHSPEDMRFINQICAQWHHDAIGYWPGRAPTEKGHSLDGETGEAISLIASAGTLPCGDWFADPKFTEPTPLTVTDEGRVFGHLAAWDSCHIGFPDTCVSPPTSASGYAYFLTGYITTDQGPVPVGQITLGGGHAGPSLSMRAAIAHYDDTGCAVADVACGDDDHGIWLAGALRSSVTAQQVAELRASPLSGDWRTVRGSMELVAALAVNVQGFPVPRIKVGVSGGTQMGLVAAGVVQRPTVDLTGLASMVAKIIEASAERKAKVAALVARVKGD